MIGLDTNVLVRYIAQDDQIQSPVATTLIETLSVANPGFITLVSLVELVWVMQRCYTATKKEILVILDTLLRTQEFSFENSETVMQAMKLFAVPGADFSDCLIERSAYKAGCDFTVTFDAKAAKSAGMRLL
ncbi:MAG: type II toxin-antitoxin system VapC family toxin [Pseudomonadota bacterium]|nr:type II toxin-antitoxin system VapC family toxin [Pseudomonadota bacterium]